MDTKEFKDTVYYLIGLDKMRSNTRDMTVRLEYTHKLEFELDLLASKLGLKDD